MYIFTVFREICFGKHVFMFSATFCTEISVWISKVGSNQIQSTTPLNIWWSQWSPNTTGIHSHSQANGQPSGVDTTILRYETILAWIFNFMQTCKYCIVHFHHFWVFILTDEQSFCFCWNGMRCSILTCVFLCWELCWKECYDKYVHKFHWQYLNSSLL